MDKENVILRFTVITIQIKSVTNQNSGTTRGSRYINRVYLCVSNKL